MWKLTVDGRTVWSLDLTVEQAQELERRFGQPFHRMSPWYDVNAAATIARMFGFDPARVRLSDFELADDDLPDVYENGIPEGGRYSDRWVAQLCLPPFSFTPKQVREEFTVRDLHLIVHAKAGRDG